MRVWLITVGEPLPTDAEDVRLMRTGIVAEMLAARGHEVIWWTSTVNHKMKSRRFAMDTTLTVRERYRITLLHGLAYQNNVSLQRIANHIGVARGFRAATQNQPRPDVILCSLPTLELSHEATEFGRKHGVPVVLDVRDLWPDIFVEIAPRWGRGIARALLSPMYRSANRSCARATAITGITSEIVDWGVGVAGRARGPLDREFPLAYMQRQPDAAQQERARAFWRSHGIDDESKPFVTCFFGSLGSQFDMQPIFEAASRMAGERRDIRFIICGDGAQLAGYRAQAADCPNVLLPGWIGAAEIWTLMRMASAGFAPYVNRFDFAASLPNKSIEYLSAGLPILTGLRTGVLKALLENERCGFVYSDGAELESILQSLYDDPQKQERAAENARGLYERRFVGERVYSDMCDYLEKIALQAQSSSAAVRRYPNIRSRDNGEARV